MPFTTYISDTTTEPEDIYAPAMSRPVIDYVRLMEIRQGPSKHVPSLALAGVDEECQRLTEEHRQDQVVNAVFDAVRPWERLFTYSAIDRRAWAWEQYRRELSARRHSQANYLRAVLTTDQHWPGHQAVKRPDFAALDAAFSTAAFDVETDFATGEVLNVIHSGDFFHTGALPRR